MDEAVHIGKSGAGRYGAAMLQVVAEQRRIGRALKRLHGALQGVPARGVRLTWRGGELRTTLHWARDDGFWWAIAPRHTRDALVLGHAPLPPSKRESVTCEINLPRAGADRKVAGIVAEDDSGTLYLAHSGRLGGARPGHGLTAFRDFLSDGVWRPVRWPDGETTEALIVAPLESPRLTRLLGRFVESVRRFKSGGMPVLQTALCVEPQTRGSIAAACDRRLVDGALYEELAKRGLFGGTPDLFSRGGDRPRPLFALIAEGAPDDVALAVGTLSLAAARQGPEVRPILVAPEALAVPESDVLEQLPFPCVRYQWRGARAVFDGLDDALE